MHNGRVQARRPGSASPQAGAALARGPPTKPQAGPAPQDGLLRRMWRLTTAATGVPLTLLDGLSREQIASRDWIAALTVRTSVPSILATTGTTQQGEFLRFAAANGRGEGRRSKIS